MVSIGTTCRRISENSTVEYGSSVSSVERVGRVSRRSDSPSSCAHLWKESETDNEGSRLVEEGGGALAYSGFPELTQLPQPFAPDSPNRGSSDSQKSSSELRSASDGWPMRDCGALKALSHCQRTITCGWGAFNLQFSLTLEKCRRPFGESYLPMSTRPQKEGVERLYIPAC